MADKITYTDKVGVRSNSLPDINKWRDDDSNEVKSKFNALVDELGLGGVDDNVRVVSINTGGATNKIKDTLDAITDSSVNKPYLVVVRPGAGTTAYVEDNFTIPAYVTLISEGGRLVTTISANTTTGNLITLSDGSSVKGFTFTGKTGAGGTCVVAGSAGNYEVDSNNVLDCDIGISISHASAKVNILNHNLETSVDTITDGVLVSAGNVTIDILKVVNSSTITNIVRCLGTSVVTGRNIESFSANTSIGIKLEDTARVNMYGISLVDCNDGVVIEDGVTATFDNVKIFNAAQDGVRCDIGDGSAKDLSFSSVLIDSESAVSPRYDLNVICPNTTARGYIQADLSKAFINPSASFVTQTLNTFSGDQKFDLSAELGVGSQIRPKEAVFGEGDSHVNELVYSFDGVSTYTDRTTEAKSDSGSTWTFDGVTSGNAIYIANILLDSGSSPIPFYGVKIDINTAAVLGAGDIIAEYWNGAWTEFNACTVKSSGSYFKFAKDYFGQTGDFHIKFDPDILDDWAPNDPVTFGSNRYWVRFRISSNITTAPIFEQNKISSSRSEKNPDGSDEYHGNARTIKKVILSAAGPIEGNMQSADIYVDENVGEGFSNNRFTTVGDILGFNFELPEDCDTSGKLILVWKGKFAAAGDPQFTIRHKVVSPGDAMTISEPAASGDTITTLSTIRTIAANVREDFRVDLDVSAAIPARENGFGDEIWVTIQYSDRSTSGNFDLVSISANYLSDQNGRHL